jgi:hypothetical protein
MQTDAISPENDRMSRYFAHNLESDKIEIYTGGKTEWMKLPPDIRKAVGRFFLFSRTDSCWRSKATGRATFGVQGVLDQLRGAGFEDRGREGERPSFAETIEIQRERAGVRAERMENRADRASREGNAHFERFRKMMDVIPFGQPILVGHHSEKRDRNYRARACGHIGKGSELLDKSKHYAGRAVTARAAADGAKYSDPGYLGRRIEECGTNIRDLERQIERFPDHAGGYLETIAQWQEKRDFYQHCLDTCSKTVWTRESLKDMTHVLCRHGWLEIVRLNQKTVSVLNTLYPSLEAQRRWPLKYLYTEIRDARRMDQQQAAG